MSMTMDRILLVDDEQDALDNYRRLLRRAPYECLTEVDARDAVDRIARVRPKVVLTDLRMPGLDGIGLLKAVKQIDANIQVVLLTAYASVQTAVESMRHGAFDYLPKPFNGQDLRSVIQRALGSRVPDPAPLGAVSMRLSNSQRRTTPDLAAALAAVASDSFLDRRSIAPPAALAGTSAAIRVVRDLVAQVAPTDASVVIVGEPGTGKEAIARALHDASPRAARPFVSVNCAGMDEGQLQRRLFGWVQDAPSPAGRPHVAAGAFMQASGGTLLLQLVETLPTRLQALLQRALKDRCARPVDGGMPYPFDVRLIVTAREDLRQVWQRGHLREDLYYLLAVVTMSVVPLRARREDLVATADALLRSMPRGGGPSALSGGETCLSRDAMLCILSEPWPGNLREMARVLARAAALAGGAQLRADHIQAARLMQGGAQ